VNVLDFVQRKRDSRKISMTTCYDYWSARIVETSDIDCVLVGDSAAMVMHGHQSTLQADIAMMAFHTSAVARGLRTKFLIADMPFLSYRRGPDATLECVAALVRAGAAALKLEGVWGHEDTITRVIGSGIPIMGHVGLTPQSVLGLGGFRVQGRDERVAEDLVAQARRLEELGCFAVVLECVPATVAAAITSALSIPTIGIGAGVDVDGQVLVLHDLLGFGGEFKPKFLKQYFDGTTHILRALNSFHSETQLRQFPSDAESYS